MFFVEIFNSFFTFCNYSSLILQLVNNCSNISYYIPLGTLFALVFYFKILSSEVINTLEFMFSMQLNTNMKDAISIALKFLLCIALLIFARGGIPRFRFDYLTKLGWIRFLSLVLLSFLVELLILSFF